MADIKAPTVTEFQAELQNVALVIDRLRPLCDKTEELQELVELALSNAAQARLLMKQMAETRK